jgi:hypothetical protein
MPRAVAVTIDSIIYPVFGMFAEARRNLTFRISTAATRAGIEAISVRKMLQEKHTGSRSLLFTIDLSWPQDRFAPPPSRRENPASYQ